MRRLNEYTAYLLDLDGTLLELSFREFTEHYYRSLLNKVQTVYDPDIFLKALDSGIRAMLHNNGTATNEEIFFIAFEKTAGKVDDEIKKLFEDFYLNDFKSLSIFGKPREGAKEFVRILKNDGKKIVVATNPVFPERAVHERLRWAGLNPQDFDLITTFEIMKACKPSPLYFNQILEILDIESDDAIMIGDDPDLDGGALNAGIDLILFGAIKDCIEISDKRVMCVKDFEEISLLYQKGQLSRGQPPE